MEPSLGVKSKKLVACVAAAVKVSAFEVTFEIVNDCGLGEAPVGVRNTRPVGVTPGAAGVPAGPMVSTIAIETGGGFSFVGGGAPGPQPTRPGRVAACGVSTWSLSARPLLC